MGRIQKQVTYITGSASSLKGLASGHAAAEASMWPALTLPKNKIALPFGTLKMPVRRQRSLSFIRLTSFV